MTDPTVSSGRSVLSNSESSTRRHTSVRRQRGIHRTPVITNLSFQVCRESLVTTVREHVESCLPLEICVAEGLHLPKTTGAITLNCKTPFGCYGCIVMQLVCCGVVRVTIEERLLLHVQPPEHVAMNLTQLSLLKQMKNSISFHKVRHLPRGGTIRHT